MEEEEEEGRRIETTKVGTGVLGGRKGGKEEANSSGTETFSRMKGDLSHKSTYKRKLPRITMIKKC